MMLAFSKHKFKVLILAMIYCWSLTALAANYGDSFILTITDMSLKVKSPAARVGNPFVIIENKTLGKLMANLVNGKGDSLKQISLEAEKSVTVELKASASDRIFFVPLSPPGQEIELIFGQKNYEIPEKK